MWSKSCKAHLLLVSNPIKVKARVPGSASSPSPEMEKKIEMEGMRLKVLPHDSRQTKKEQSLRKLLIRVLAHCTLIVYYGGGILSLIR